MGGMMVGRGGGRRGEVGSDKDEVEVGGVEGGEVGDEVGGWGNGGEDVGGVDGGVGGEVGE